MTKRSRYLLIALGACIFAVLAPAIVIYSAGLSIDWKNKKITRTGIIAFKVEPKNPNIFLNEQDKTGSGENIKFLKSQDYELRFEAESYCYWQKKLLVTPGEVTWASPYGGKIHLLKNSPPAKIISESVDDFFYYGNTLYSVKENLFSTLDLGNNSTHTLTLPKDVKNISHISGSDKFLVYNSSEMTSGIFLVDGKNTTLYDLSKNFSELPKILYSGTSIFALENKTLYKVSSDFSTKTEFKSNVLDYNILNDSLYYISSNASTTELIAFSLNENQETLISTLPQLLTAKVLVTGQKQIFVEGDNQLYQIGFNQKNLGPITTKDFEASSPKLIYIGGGEANFYDFNKNETRLISRSSQNLQNPILATNIGYAIWQKGNIIEAVELDTRDHQNSCELFKSPTIQKFQTDEENRRLLILDNNQIKIIDIQ
ncbi:MAG: hypothetical protein JNN11_03890 [Candidatus Doudnabacteria bacterium]|nr:hypothetical protein [Candidatus Doudnabacteria bacterium]